MLKATTTWGPAVLWAVTCSHLFQGGEGSRRRQFCVGLEHVSTFWKLLGRVAEPTVRCTGQPRLALVAQPCSSSRSACVNSGTKTLCPTVLWGSAVPLTHIHTMLTTTFIRSQSHTHSHSGFCRSGTQPQFSAGLRHSCDRLHQFSAPQSLAWGTHSLEVAGPGQEDLREGHVRLKDGGLQHPHDQHLGVEDTGTGRKGTLEESGGERECELQVARTGLVLSSAPFLGHCTTYLHFKLLG